MCAVVLAAALLCSCGKHAAAYPKAEVGLVAAPAGSGYEEFSRAAADGLAECRRESGASVSTLPSETAADYESRLVLLATENSDSVIGLGFPVAPDVARVARRFENVHFVLVDAVVNLPNVNSITFNVNEGAFLAGALAAMQSKTRSVAFIGGSDIPLLRESVAGFTAGAREIDPNVHVTARFLNSYTDRDAGARAAADLFAGGADVIYVIAGDAGKGAIGAARDHKGLFVIGADVDQDGLAPGKVLTSVMKRVDLAVLRSCLETVAQKPASGHTRLGLASGGVALTDFAYTKGEIGAARIARLARIRQAIVDGRIVPPSDMKALAAFKPPAVP